MRAARPDRPRPAALAGVAGTGVALSALVLSGRALPFPSTSDADELAEWARVAGTATVAFTTLRAAAVALLVWCMTTWAAGVLARRLRRRRLVALLDRVSPRVVRHLAEAAASIGLVVGGLSPAAGASARTTNVPIVTMVDLGPTMTDLGPVAPPPPSTPSPRLEALEPDVPDTNGAGDASGFREATWTVRAGDTMWHVAEMTATEALGRPAGLDEVAARLDELVALNEDRLAVPGDPSLVFPGQVFLLG